MDINKLKLKQLRGIVKDLLERAEKNGHSSSRHLKITYSWLRFETDEDLFETLKKGPGREYITDLLPIEEENK